MNNQLLSDEELGRIAYKGYDDYWTEDCPGRESEAWEASARAVISAHTAKLLEMAGEVVAWRWRFLNQPDKTWRHCERRPNFDPAVVDGEPLVPATALAAARAEIADLKAKHQALAYERDGMLEELAAARARIADLESAINAELDPSWQCNSYHPKLLAAMSGQAGEVGK